MGQQQITRHFATLGDRQLHYRRAGKGSPLISVHEAPQSSRTRQSLMLGLADEFMVIAPDIAGYGISDPLPGRPSLADYAHDLALFMDAIDLPRAAIHGVGSGASIVTEFARQYPWRVTVTIAESFLALSSDQRANFRAKGIPSFEPRWDGGHLAWCWSRIKEDFIFFPWHEAASAARLLKSVPPPVELQLLVLDLLRAGPGYGLLLDAVYRECWETALADLTGPCYLLGLRSDVRCVLLDRLRAPDKNIVVARLDSFEALLDQIRTILRRHPAPADGPPVRAPSSIENRLWNDYATLPEGQVRLRRNDRGSGEPLVFLHDAAGSGAIVARIGEALIGLRPVIIPDLPGRGESDDLLPETPRVEDEARVLGQTLAEMGISRASTGGMWGGALVALELSLQRPELVAALVLTDMIYFDADLTRALQAQYTPRITPDFFGGHLLMCWHLMRDQGLFWPWFDRSAEAALGDVFAPVDRVHLRVTEMLKAGNRYRDAYQAHFAYPVEARLRQAVAPIFIGAPSWDPNAVHTRAAALACRAPYRELPRDPGLWGALIHGFIEKQSMTQPTPKPA
jgi:pimeloyl-ACP methyl ester carboxylesterase